MKILVENYSFVASTGVITFTDYNPVLLESVLMITNVTLNIIVYNFADSTKGGAVSTNTLTLDYDTSTGGHQDADDLQIWYEDLAQTGDTTDLATSALQLVDGHNVTVDNAGGVEVVQDTAADLNVTEASAADILVDTTSIDGKITACNTGAVTISAALPAGSANIGDVDVASIDCDSINGPGVPVIDSYTQASINITAGTDQVLVSSAASKQIWVYGIGFTLSVDGTVSIQDEDDAAITGIMPFAGKSGMILPVSGNFAMPIWKLATDKDLEIDLVTADLDGWLCYAIVSV